MKTASITLNETIRDLCVNMKSDTAMLSRVRNYPIIVGTFDSVDLVMFLAKIKMCDLHRVLNKDSINLKSLLVKSKGSEATLVTRRVISGREVPFVGKVGIFTSLQYTDAIDNIKKSVKIVSYDTESIILEKDVLIPIGSFITIYNDKKKELEKITADCPTCGIRQQLHVQRHSDGVDVISSCISCHKGLIVPAQKQLKSWILGELQSGVFLKTLDSMPARIPLNKADIQVKSTNSTYRVRHNGSVITCRLSGSVLIENRKVRSVPFGDVSVDDIHSQEIDGKMETVYFGTYEDRPIQGVRREVQWSANGSRILSKKKYLKMGGINPYSFDGDLIEKYECYGDRMCRDLKRIFNRIKATHLIYKSRVNSKSDCRASVRLFKRILLNKDCCMQQVFNSIKFKLKLMDKIFSISSSLNSDDTRLVVSLYLAIERAAVLDVSND